MNVGYVLDQLRRAVKALVHRPQPAAQTRAEEKVARWHAVLDGLLTGSLQVGSRTPLAEIPPWVTLGVVKGGFATGQLLAAGPLTPHERERLATLPEPAEPLPERSRLNAWFLGDEGRHALEEMLRGGGYRIRVPEEGALLTVTWLLGRGESQRALELLETLAPLTDRLRFYPTPDPHPLSADGLVHLRTVGDTVERLEKLLTLDAMPPPPWRARAPGTCSFGPPPWPFSSPASWPSARSSEAQSGTTEGERK